MIVTRSIAEQTWVDLNSPTEEEADSLVLTYHIDPSIARDLIAPTPKQHLRISDHALYAVIHIPVFKHSHTESSEQEIDLVITKKELITARYDSIDALHYFAKQVEVDDILKRTQMSHPLFPAMKEIYKSLFDELFYIEDWLKEIEKNIFQGQEKAMVTMISAASRNLLSFRRIVLPHEGVWIFLIEEGKDKFGGSFARDAKSLLEEWKRLSLTAQNIDAMIVELRETNNSLLSTKQNEIMKTLTIMAFIVVPLATISQIFGMNTVYNPIIGAEGDFWIISAIMLCMTLAMFIFFKYKKWI